MASLQQEPTGVFHIIIRISGKRFKRSLGTKLESQAIARRDEIEETIDLINRERLQIPDHMSAIDFVLANGKPSNGSPSTKPQSSIASKPDEDVSISLTELFNQFFESIPDGNIEPETLKMMHIHKRHLLRILKPSFNVASLKGNDLQSYVNKRAKQKSQMFADKVAKKKSSRKLVSATTIRKEITTLGAAWRWATTVPLVEGVFPNRGLRYPKIDEKPPFQTWAEIERQIELGDLSFGDQSSLWECLYLRKTEIDDLLNFVEQAANFEFVYPMFVMAAFTGARRSELIRSQVSDFDFEQDFVTIRERKRVKGQRSTRRVPLTKQLKKVISTWLDNAHPGGSATFAHERLREGVKAITVNQAQSHFQNTLTGSRWEKLKGWHCLRHSSISNLACAGVDQRIIDDFVGHTTEDMRRRYRHLFPDVKKAALSQVFE